MRSKVFVRKNPILGFFCFSLVFAILTLPASATGSVRVNKISDKISENNIDCTIEYPYVTGLYDLKRQEALNTGFTEKAKNLRTQAEYHAKNGAVQAEMKYNVTRNQGGVLSLVTTTKINSTDCKNEDKDSITFNTVTGKTYFLSDLFINNADYVQVLKERAKPEGNKDTLKTTAFIKNNLKIKENQKFYLTDDKLVLIVNDETKDNYTSDKMSTGHEYSVPLIDLLDILKNKIVDGY